MELKSYAKKNHQSSLHDLAFWNMSAVYSIFSVSRGSMYRWAIACGIFSYYLFFLGSIAQLQFVPIMLGATVFIVYSFSLLWKNLQSVNIWHHSFVTKILLIILSIQALINLVGAFGPELGFDAIWYHLTIPRIWLMEGQIMAIPHGPFYYALLPKLVDMLYLVPLLLHNEVGAKLLHFFFGVLSVYCTYKLGRQFLNKQHALLAAVLFYSNLVVSWQSITAYIDLGRTFFESLAALALVEFFTTKRNASSLTLPTMLGLAVTSKILALGSSFASTLLLFFKKEYRAAFLTAGMSILIPLPWLVLNWMENGNPIYPVFSGYGLDSQWHAMDIFTIWVRSADPISPIYLIVLPLIVLSVTKKFSFLFHGLSVDKVEPFTALLWYSLLTLLFWWLLPRTGGGRFLMPYLPAYSVLVVVTIGRLKDTYLQKATHYCLILLALLSICYRTAANARYLPYFLGKESKAVFLQKNIDLTFGDNWYYLTDDSLRSIYKPEKKWSTQLKWQFQEENHTK